MTHLKSHVAKIKRGWSLKLLHHGHGLKQNSSKRVWSYTLSFQNCLGCFIIPSTQMQYTRFPIKLKHTVAVTNKTETMLSSPGTINFNATICFNSIRESNVHYLSFPPEVLPKKIKEIIQIWNLQLVETETETLADQMGMVRFWEWSMRFS